MLSQMHHSPAEADDLPDLAEALTTESGGRRVLVAIDGVDGSGKTTIASELASQIRARGRPVVLLHVDDFMHLRMVRHRRGRNSPLGYFLDSYDYDALKDRALKPLAASGSGIYQAGITDRRSDQRVNFPALTAPEDAVVIVEGLFLHRDELADWWDYSVFISSNRFAALERKAQRDGLTIDPDSQRGRRYLVGQILYLDSCHPQERATWLLDPVPGFPGRVRARKRTSLG